jgi:hypothetical protein
MKIRGDEPFFGLKSLCFVAILDMSLISRSCKNDHIIFNVGTPSLKARNIRLYEYGHEQVKLRKKRWNMKEISLKIHM